MELADQREVPAAAAPEALAKWEMRIPPEVRMKLREGSVNPEAMVKVGSPAIPVKRASHPLPARCAV